MPYDQHQIQQWEAWKIHVSYIFIHLFSRKAIDVKSVLLLTGIVVVAVWILLSFSGHLLSLSKVPCQMPTKHPPLTQKPNFIVHFNSKKLKKLTIYYVAKWNSAKTGVVTRFYNHNQLILRPNIRWSLIASYCLHHLFFTRKCETYSLEVFLQWAMGGVYWPLTPYRSKTQKIN